MGIFFVIALPVAAVIFVVGGGAVKAVEACQRRFCGDALEDTEDVESGAVELEEGPVRGGRRMSGEMSSNNTTEEESQALMGRVEK
jgi:hypothetical protein